MLKWFRPEYRIVQVWSGYAVQYRRWYWPFWARLNHMTHESALDASDWLKGWLEHKQWALYLGRL